MIVKTGQGPLIVGHLGVSGINGSLKSFPKPTLSYLLVKRCFDLIVSALLTAGVLSWLLPVLAIMIKLDSRGPVFFLQKRMGKGGQPFTCFKLRTMVRNSEADEQPATWDDWRVTRLGRWLRKSHLDELPQLINVLLGSMSLVGPRPYMLADNQRFSDFIPDYYYRAVIRPGITGLAQVKGLHGSETDHQTILWRHQWDAFYVRNAGMRLDLRILRSTFRFFLNQSKPLCR
ncbi:MAG TPA: sugar transferase [Puia sp.]|jgi:putative colanic acid biosynthesis UDP-glucose lipid carrier transferase|nr:sugar transferase [Puia sp.]